LVERLEEDHALATEAAGEQDQDGTGLQRLPRVPGTDGFADLMNISRQLRDSRIDCIFPVS